MCKNSLQGGIVFGLEYCGVVDFSSGNVKKVTTGYPYKDEILGSLAFQNCCGIPPRERKNDLGVILKPDADNPY